MSSTEAIKLLVFAVLIGWVLMRNLPGAILFLWPGFTRYRKISRNPQQTAGVAVRDMLDDLASLNFELLGAAGERRPLRSERDEWVLASPAEHSWAVVRPVKDEAWLHFVTPFTDGSLVISADHVWPAADKASYQAGGLPGSTPAQLLNAHRRRVQRLLEEGRKPSDLGFDDRVQMVRHFYISGPGRAETRRRELTNAILSAAALTFVGLLLKQLLRR